MREFQSRGRQTQTVPMSTARGRAGVGEIFELEVACTPPFSEAELTTLAARGSALVA